MSFTLPLLPDCANGALDQLAMYARLLEVSTGAVFIRSPRRECTIRSRHDPVPAASDRAAGRSSPIAARSRNISGVLHRTASHQRDWRARCDRLPPPAGTTTDTVQVRIASVQ